MSKRLLLITITLAVLTTLGVLGYKYVNRYGAQRPLLRAQSALRADDPAKAEGLAAEYVADQPDDWQGYHTLAIARQRQGRYEEARQPLNAYLERVDADASEDLAPGEIAIRLELARCHHYQAANMLSSAALTPKVSTVQKAIVLFLAARRVSASPKMVACLNEDLDKTRIDLLEWRGVNEMYLARAARLLQSLRGDQTPPATPSNESAPSSAPADSVDIDEAERLAIDLLFRAIEADPTRDSSAMRLLRLCIRRRDADAVAKLRKVILGIDQIGQEPLKATETTPPRTASALLMQDMAVLARRESTEAMRRHWAQADAFLTSLLTIAPDDPRTDVKVAITEVAIEQALIAQTPDRGSYIARAHEFCRQALDEQSRNRIAKLFEAKILRLQQRTIEAEEKLAQMTSETGFGDWAPALEAFVNAALENGHNDQAARAVTRLLKVDPSNAMARRFEARRWSANGVYDRALEEMLALYKASPNPNTLLSAVGYALTASKRTEALRMLTEADEAFANRPAMRSAVIAGYSLLGDEAKARELALKLIEEIKPEGVNASLAVADALVRVGQFARAEALLKAVLAGDLRHNLTRASVHYRLGQLYEQTGQWIDAPIQYGLAVSQAPGEERYRLALAASYKACGDLAARRTDTL